MAVESIPNDPANLEPVETDGRRARRDRNRDTVVDALLDLYQEGDLAPSGDTIAVRAGLSPRSLFRYFDDIDDLCRAAIERQLGRVRHLVIAVVPIDASLAQRIDGLVQQRLTLFDAIAPVARVARMRAPLLEPVAAQVRRGRRQLHRQVLATFAPELAAMEPEVAERRALAADALCSFETYDILRTDKRLSRVRTAATLVEGLQALFISSPPAPVQEGSSR